MKLCSKEALVLGGLYGVVATPLSLSGADNFSGVLFGLFFIGMLMLCFNKTPKFLEQFIVKFPKSSYYLSAIGWMPYFLLITTVFVIGGGYFFAYSEEFEIRFLLWVTDAYPWMFFISLAIAFIRQRREKKGESSTPR